MYIFGTMVACDVKIAKKIIWIADLTGVKGQIYSSFMQIESTKNLLKMLVTYCYCSFH